MEKRELLVISASRRTDLVSCYPETLIERLREFPPDKVHSVVIWTKNPQNMIAEGPLNSTLREYRQIYVHLTITGMGAGEFEPMIPPWPEVVRMIGPLIDLVNDSRRISWRFDPILEVEGPAGTNSSIILFPELAEAIAFWGVKVCRVSWVSPYKKVLLRLEKKGWRLIPRTIAEREIQADRLVQVARKHGMALYFCSMEGFPISSCIDGQLLSQLHPSALPCSTGTAKGQRLLCGCTQSTDIGWYSLCCRNGCLYCYACP